MSAVTIFGKGNMGTAIKSVFEDAGATVQALDSHDENPTIQGDIVVLAVPYPALASIAKQYGDQLAGKTVVDITNPLDFSTFDSLVVPADSSAAAELQKLLPSPTCSRHSIPCLLPTSLPKRRATRSPPCSLPATTQTQRTHSSPWLRPAGSTPSTQEP